MLDVWLVHPLAAERPDQPDDPLEARPKIAGQGIELGLHYIVEEDDRPAHSVIYQKSNIFARHRL